MQKRIESWGGRFLWKAGREILLKTVAQAISSYAMSIFFLPIETCKQAWQLLQFEDSLVGRVYKARYFPNGSMLTASLGANSRFIWRSLFENQAILLAGAKVRVGLVELEVLNSPWLAYDSNPFVTSTHPALDHCKAKQLRQINGEA
uniref:Uncharacterized protein n=1 Tax=Cannabis sativa TaxID=3483 RepID=A0A803QKZ9_CANSA